MKKHAKGCVARLGRWLFVGLCVSVLFPTQAASESQGQQNVTEDAVLAQAHEAFRRRQWEIAIRLLSDRLQ
ncbi:MAG TPA: hypothetical protein VMG63_10335, partial [Terriglobia bacterium]|nr:hypothetical protein [Terriglobia bacterium]